MEKRLLKTTLFGFSKTDVCEYIAKVNADFSKKLLTLSEEHKTEKDALTQKIADLEAELAKYKKVYADISADQAEMQFADIDKKSLVPKESCKEVAV